MILVYRVSRGNIYQNIYLGSCKFDDVIKTVEFHVKHLSYYEDVKQEPCKFVVDDSHKFIAIDHYTHDEYEVVLSGEILRKIEEEE